MSENKHSNSADSEARKESSYPLYPLEEALKLADAVREMGGNRSPVPKALLAKRLNYAQTGPSFVQRIASAKTYGLIDGWGTYTLTDQAKRYFYPTIQGEKERASLSFLSNPSVFKLLIQRFDGEKLPPNDMLGNILHQDSRVPTSWKDRLAAMFVRSAQFIGIIDANGYLRYSAGIQHESADQSPANAELERTPSEERQFKINVSPSAQFGQPGSVSPGHTLWTFRHKGSHIKLETPEDMSKELWDKLNAYVQQVLKPIDNGNSH